MLPLSADATSTTEGAGDGDPTAVLATSAHPPIGPHLPQTPSSSAGSPKASAILSSRATRETVNPVRAVADDFERCLKEA